MILDSWLNLMKWESKPFWYDLLVWSHGWYLHFLKAPVVLSGEQLFYTCVLCSLRSRDFGSPQCRLRFYVLGVRCDLVGYAGFSSMLCFLRNCLQKVHEYAGVSDVVRHLEKCGCAQRVEPSPVVKDPPCIDQISSDSHIRHEQSRR